MRWVFNISNRDKNHTNILEGKNVQNDMDIRVGYGRPGISSEDYYGSLLIKFGVLPTVYFILKRSVSLTMKLNLLRTKILC